MSTSSAKKIGSTASTLIEDEGGWGAFMQNVILGGIVFQIYAQALEGIDAVGMIVLGPVRALGRGMIMLVNSTIGNVIAVFDAGTQATILSFQSGVASLLGPLAQPTSVGIGMLSIGVFIIGVNRLNISPLSFWRSLRE